MEETPILSSKNQVIEKLRTANREFELQCAQRNRELEKKLEKCFDENKALQDEINQLTSTILVLEAEIDTFRREKPVTTTHFGENVLSFGACDTSGNSLELISRSDIQLHLGNFTIRQIVGDATIEISLPRRATILPQSTLKIYARTSTIDEETQRIVLDDIDKWSTGESVQTFLLDKNRAEVASIFQTLD